MYPRNFQQPRIGVRREPAIVLLLSIVTCGIYYLFFLYYASAEMIAFDLQPDTDPGLEVVISVVTCGIYTTYWDYKSAGKIARMQQKVGLMPVDNSILYLILNFVGLGVIPALIEQGHLNDIWFRAEQNYAQTGSYYATV